MFRNPASRFPVEYKAADSIKSDRLAGAMQASKRRTNSVYKPSTSPYPIFATLKIISIPNPGHLFASVSSWVFPLWASNEQFKQIKRQDANKS
ncbi:hypothetical protein COCNU_08G005750 [Cocos nucifera]|uniref:Uncharacterized protein n=1 Tax=Cocos nucifera TaxID=13894 RepID=A0A8K0N6C4_COCNU|nr:hypothetical protein COCNU_08G005750 [Cocos nucifera]